MNRRPTQFALLALAAAFSLPAAAVKGEKVETCLELDGSHTLKRSGSQFLYVKNGGEHYRVSFVAGHCGQLAVSGKFTIDTGGDSGRICPTGSRVRAKGASCQVSGIERIEGDDFARLTRKRR